MASRIAYHQRKLNFLEEDKLVVGVGSVAYVVSHHYPSLKPRLSVPDFVLQLWRKKSEVKPGRISHVISGAVVTAVPCKHPKRHNVMGVALSRSAKKSSFPRIQLHMALLISRTGKDGYKTVS